MSSDCESDDPYDVQWFDFLDRRPISLRWMFPHTAKKYDTVWFRFAKKSGIGMADCERIAPRSIKIRRAICASAMVQGVPPGHEHLNIGRIKFHSSMTFV
jgi:hypothetical protein